jgi:hypothetical protein
VASTSSSACPSPKRSSSPARRSSPLLRWLRFGLYASLCAAVLARNATPLLQSLRLVTSPLYWSSWAPSLPVALGMLALVSAYLVWLSGATLAGWRMPLAVHLVPIALFTHSLAAGPLVSHSDGFAAQGPADRAVAAIRALQASIEKQERPPCSVAAAQYEEALTADPALAPPGYRSFGSSLRFRVVAREGSGPQHTPGRPGELHLVCSGNRYWISAVTTDAVPVGRPTMVRDGVGRVVTFTGEVPR